jgi:FkbM family methyltransferase
VSYSLLTTRHGLFLAEDQDMISKILKIYGEWSEGSIQLLDGIINKGDTVVDVGGNIGTFCLPLANAVGPEGTVVCFEPQQQVFYNLCANLLLNQCNIVDARNILIANESKNIQDPAQHYNKPSKSMINRGGMSYIDALAEEGSVAPGGRKLRVSTLDKELSTLHQCDLIKVDVEGAENLVLAGAEEIIRRHRPTLYLECSSQSEYEIIKERLLKWDYTLFWHPCMQYNPENFFNQPNLLGSRGDLNLLCIPDEKKDTMRYARSKDLHEAVDWVDTRNLFPHFEF